MNARRHLSAGVALALVGATTFPGASSAWAAGKVWRCTDVTGRTVYQDTACASPESARDLPAVPAPDAREQAEAQRRATAERELAERLTADRLRAERAAAQQRPIQLAGPPPAAASAPASLRKRKPTKTQAEPVGPATPIKAPGSLQKAGPAAP
jgi:hypothetical protein